MKDIVNDTLKKEFVTVLDASKYSLSVVEAIVGLNEIQGCSVTTYAGTITIVCKTLEGFEYLVRMCRQIVGPHVQFFKDLGAELAKFKPRLV